VPDEDEAIEEYRLGARVWLADHVLPRTGRRPRRTVDDYTPEVLAESRVLQRTMFDAGYAGITWPTEYGGQGLSSAYESAFLEEAARYELPDFGPLTATTFQICVPTMLAHASPEFLARFVPKVLVGEALVCQFFSEPSSGSDLAGVRTRARRDGDQWVINGQKVWSTFAHLADWGMCLARTDWDAPKHRGLTWFAVRCDAPGVTIRPIQQIGETAEFCEDFFDDVVVPDADRVGDVNAGWAVTRTMLGLERAARRPEETGLGGGPGALAPDLVRLAARAGRIDDPVVRQRLARAHSAEFVGRALAARVGEHLRRGERTGAFAAYDKLFRGTYNPIRARLAVEIGGAPAMTWIPGDAEGAETSLAYLNGRTSSIAGGTNEMQRNAIAEQILGLPREASVDADRPFREVVRDVDGGRG